MFASFPDFNVTYRSVNEASTIPESFATTLPKFADVSPEEAPLPDVVTRAGAELFERIRRAVGAILRVERGARARGVVARHVAVLVDVEAKCAAGGRGRGCWR